MLLRQTAIKSDKLIACLSVYMGKKAVVVSELKAPTFRTSVHITLHYVTYIALHCITLHYITLFYLGCNMGQTAS